MRHPEPAAQPTCCRPYFFSADFQPRVGRKRPLAALLSRALRTSSADAELCCCCSGGQGMCVWQIEPGHLPVLCAGKGRLTDTVAIFQFWPSAYLGMHAHWQVDTLAETASKQRGMLAGKQIVGRVRAHVLTFSRWILACMRSCALSGFDQAWERGGLTGRACHAS